MKERYKIRYNIRREYGEITVGVFRINSTEKFCNLNMLVFI